ncbi:hypothetical protein F4677DRAFT_461415 [Hypoxylon crocopeplum]|nr:hypothetical protein F4677DRAFT_461415 [Hypoxylon crocopeplum]
MINECECRSDVNLALWSKGEWREEQVKCADFLCQDPEDLQWPCHAEGEVVIIMAKANRIRNCASCRESFIRRLHMPQLWWSDTYKRMNGYFGTESRRNAEGVIESYSTWSRALVKHFDPLSMPMADFDIQYRWLKLNLFTRWIKPRKMVILAFDPVGIIQDRLFGMLLQRLGREELHDPYWPYTRILEELVALQGTTVWSLRDLIRTTELSPSRDHRNLQGKPKYNYSRLHDIARHAIHISETLDLSVRLSESVIEEHKQLMSSISDIDPRGPIENPQQIKHALYDTCSRLAFFNHALFSLRCRSTSNNQRLNNEIQLRFHTDSQYDSQASIEINHSTKSDSASMRWIAIVSLVFLPANLVSSIFSTTFFDVTNDMVSVTKDFWIYWVVLVAVTAVTLAFWFYLPRLTTEERVRQPSPSDMWPGTKKSLRSLAYGLKGERSNLDSATWA